MLGEIGTFEWTRRTNGRLTRAERARYIAVVLGVQAKATPLLLASRLGWRSRRRAGLSDLDPPDSRVVRETAEACAELLPPFIVGHNYRSFLYARALAQLEGLRPDEEALFVAAMYHDAGALEPDLSDGGRCFTLSGAEQAEARLRDAGFPADSCELAADAVTLHANPTVSRKQGELAYVLHDGVLLDVVGLRSWQLEREAIRSVRERHPRLDATRRLGQLVKAQGDAIPACRIAAAFQAGFGLAMKLGPWQD
jgi:hypothetical protein